MAKKITQRYTPITTLLKDVQSHSVLAGERRTTILKVEIIGEPLSDLDLNCADFIDSEISDSTFFNSDLRGASFKDSKMERVKFINCSICDMELPEDFSSITFHNCSTMPSGMTEAYKAAGEPPSTFYGKVLGIIEATTRGATSLTTDKLLSLAVIVAFIAIIAVAISMK